MSEKRRIEVSERELKQLEYQRKFGYGKIEVHMEAGQPIRIVEARKNIKL